MVIGKLKIEKTKLTAWRGVYGYWGYFKFFHLCFDPLPTKPQISGSLCGKGFRKTVPHLKWKHKGGKVYSFCYLMQSKFLHNMDGRYGWNNEKIRAAVIRKSNKV